ncbi:methyltransferase domain-containing protein [Myxococcus sp. AB025B]|uniref:methyltransferase domain-containing protein n=1 Tax=Myxococcus sp. AB025B TaxID=2562794 RepID=UPI001890E790|nr:methyltransferase domain-containing protein [Myxococcus sp. AB025B]
MNPLAAELVGPSGEVVGIDGAAQPLEWAWRRARERGLSQVRFQHCDMASLPRERLFDAVVERRVLIHQRDPLRFIQQMETTCDPGACSSAITWTSPFPP